MYKLSFLFFLLRNINKKKFICPICSYHGPFRDIKPVTGLRKHAQCPKCSGMERHRIQFLVVEKIMTAFNPSSLKMLHFAPEPFFREYFSRRFKIYETADLNLPDVDYAVDLMNLPFDDQSYDFVFASHVLEHITDDEKAISEIRRILKPNGIAILPVPIFSQKTIEYPEPNPNESDHVRAPGLDYYDRFEPYFSRIERYASDSLPEKYQLFIYEDRSKWPTREFPLRNATPGEKHMDIVPVCYV